MKIEIEPFSVEIDDGDGNTLLIEKDDPEAGPVLVARDETTNDSVIVRLDDAALVALRDFINRTLEARA